MRRLLTVAVCILVPGLAFATPIRPTTRHARVRVRHDERHYALVTSAQDLRFEVDGPGTVTFYLRQSLRPGMHPGRTTTKVGVTLDGKVVRTLFVHERIGGRWASRLRGRPSRLRTVAIDVTGGHHAFVVSIAPKGRRMAIALDLASQGMGLVALVPLSKKPASGNGGIPLVGLTPKKKHANENTGSGEIPLVSLAPKKKAHEGGTTKTGAVAMADTHGRRVEVKRLGDHSDEGGLVAAPLAPVHAPAAPRHHGRFLVGVRGLLASHGLGGGAIGGGIDVAMHTSLLDGRLALGASVDLLPYSLHISYGAGQTVTLGMQAIPILANASYILPGPGPLRFRGTVGLGLVLAGASFGTRSGSAVVPGGALDLGVLLDAGPGSLTAAVRLTGGWGRIDPASGADRSTIVSGPMGGLGVTIGYAIEML